MNKHIIDALAVSLTVLLFGLISVTIISIMTNPLLISLVGIILMVIIVIILTILIDLPSDIESDNTSEIHEFKTIEDIEASLREEIRK